MCSDKPYTCTTCHRGESTTMRKDIAHYKLISGKYASFTDKSSPKTQNGIELIKDAACTRCHNIGTSGATLASDLNSAVKRLTTDELIKAIKEPVINMPDFQFSNQDIENLITGLYYYTIPQDSKSITQVVHFQGDTGGNDIFQKKCGTCHKALTSAGALGNSDDAPNLSNLTNSYPDYLNGSSWNKAHLVCKRSSFLFHIFLLCIVCKVCRHNYAISYKKKQGIFYTKKLDFVF